MLFLRPISFPNSYFSFWLHIIKKKLVSFHIILHILLEKNYVLHFSQTTDIYIVQLCTTTLLKPTSNPFLGDNHFLKHYF